MFPGYPESRAAHRARRRRSRTACRHPPVSAGLGARNAPTRWRRGERLVTVGQLRRPSHVMSDDEDLFAPRCRCSSGRDDRGHRAGGDRIGGCRERGECADAADRRRRCRRGPPVRTDRRSGPFRAARGRVRRDARRRSDRGYRAAPGRHRGDGRLRGERPRSLVDVARRRQAGRSRSRTSAVVGCRGADRDRRGGPDRDHGGDA